MWFLSVNRPIPINWETIYFVSKKNIDNGKKLKYYDVLRTILKLRKIV